MWGYDSCGFWLSCPDPHLRLLLSRKLSLHNNLCGYCHPLLTFTYTFNLNLPSSPDPHLDLVHDSVSAWRSWVHDSHDWITLRLPFAHEAMIAADFDFRIWDPHLDFRFPESFRFTIICVAIAILSWPSLRLSILAPSLRLSLSRKLSHHNNLLGHCQPLLTLT